MILRKVTLDQKRSLYGILFVFPWILGFLLFFLYPIVHSFILSFNDVQLTTTGYALRNVNLQNYKDAFTKDPVFPRLLTESLLDLINVPIIIMFSFFVAVLLKKKTRVNNFVKAIFFLPVIIGSGVFASLQAEYGSINNVNLEATMQQGAETIQLLRSVNIGRYLMEAGVKPEIINYLTSPIDRIYQVVSFSGIQIFVFLSGLHSIPEPLYEACYIEGASGWETFWKITFPMVSPLILVNTIYSIIDNFMSSRNYTLNYIYFQAFTFVRFGLASAMTWVYFAILSVILAIVVYLISKRVFYYV